MLDRCMRSASPYPQPICEVPRDRKHPLRCLSTCLSSQINNPTLSDPANQSRFVIMECILMSKMMSLFCLTLLYKLWSVSSKHNKNCNTFA